MAYTDVAALANDQRYRDRLQQAVIAAALRVYDERDNTSGHDQRAAYARAVLSNPGQYLAVIAPATASAAYDAWQAVNPPIEEPTDEMLDEAIAAVWNALAGV